MTFETINTNMSIERPAEAFIVHWRGVLAGLFVALLTYFFLSSAGLALGFTELKNSIEAGDMPQSLGTGLGTWMILSVLISLFVGSYASGRVSGFVATRVGYVQGVVISSLFFGIMMIEAGAVVSALGSGLGALKNVAVGSTQAAMNTPAISDTIEDSLGQSQLVSDPHTVATGVLSRLARGDSDSAINYLSAQTGVSKAEARAQYDRIHDQVMTVAADWGRRAADAARTFAAFLCASVLLGTAFAMLGGALGAQFNLRKPFGKLDLSALRSLQASTI